MVAWNLSLSLLLVAPVSWYALLAALTTIPVSASAHRGIIYRKRRLITVIMLTPVGVTGHRSAGTLTGADDPDGASGL
ncbi:hypothetical protein DIJ64_14360 [Mycobacterium leprae]|nr:hypothetical protein [Mycobacterium leprae]AWV48821.1 hypothetical protein DIJ64_14360 [Mycobacterium leprae]OAX70348.1 hypothetical protein A3216_12535 [Mycobacterium leprae 7935681]